MRSLFSHLLFLALLAGSQLLPALARANCDVVPQAKPSYRSALGSIDRPYASPGDPVELVRDGGGCDGAAPQLTGAAPLVTLFFSSNGRTDAVTLGDPGFLALIQLAPNPPVCALPGGGTHQFLGTPALTSLADTLNNRDTVSFPWPDTDDVLGVSGDGLGYTGPSRIVARSYNFNEILVGPIDLHCGMAVLPCDDPTRPSSLSMCVDELLEDDSTCSTNDLTRNARFPSFTALPAMNPFDEMCQVTPLDPDCTGAEPDLRFAIDEQGNALIPVDFSAIDLEGPIPNPRFVSLRTSFPAFDSGPTASNPPSPSFYGSFSSRGHTLPPFFRRVTDPAAPADTAFLGTVDAPRVILRWERRSPVFRECRDDGSGAPLTPGLPCVVDADCPAASSCGDSVCYAAGAATAKRCANDSMCSSTQECGPALFDFTSRSSEAGLGPVVMTGSDYEAEAQNPVQLDCLEEGDGFLLACRSEIAEGVPINDDADVADQTVVELRSTVTGKTVPIDGTKLAIAANRVRKQAFSNPSVAVDGAVYALIEPEFDSGSTDFNSDGDTEDSRLRVFRFDPASVGNPVSELTSSQLTVDAGPEINDQSLVVSDGLVFFRESEPAATPQIRSDVSLDENELPLVGAGAGPAIITPDGRFAAIITNAAMVASDTNGTADVYVRDRDTDGDGVFDEAGATLTERVSLSSTGGNANNRVICCNYNISNDGRYVTYESLGTNHVVPNGDHRVYAYDRQTGITTSVFGFVAAGATLGGMSGDGRYVGVSWDTGFANAFIVDRDVDGDGVLTGTDRFHATAVSLFTTANGDSFAPLVSNDGKWFAFNSLATNLDPAGGDTNGALDAFASPMNLQNTILGKTAGPRVRVSKATALFELSEQLNAGASVRSLSADGRFLILETRSTNIPGATQDGPKWLRLDRDADEDGAYLPAAGGFPNFGNVPNDDGVRTEIKFIQPASPLIRELRLSPDGRYALEIAGIADLEGNPGFTDWFVHDLTTSAAHPVLEQTPEGTEAGFLSEAGLFRSRSHLVAGWSQAEIAGIDTADLSTDLSADGDANDLVLSALDADGAPPMTVRIGSAVDARVAAGNALFLVSERFEGPGTDLNGDADDDDQVVFVWRNRQAGAAINLGLSARAIALSDTVIAAVVAESDQGVDLNGDTDLDDWILHTNSLATATAGNWTNTGEEAYAIRVEGDRTVFLGETTFNGERVLKLREGAQTTIIDDGVSDFETAPTLIAYRKAESTTFTVPDLNGDGEEFDRVMQAYDFETQQIANSGQAALRCPYEACDPDTPYRVFGDTIVFLTRERDQEGSSAGSGCASTGTPGECDLDGDGTNNGVILSRFDVGKIRIGMTVADALSSLPTTAGGICTDTAEACVANGDCASGECFLPPGGCVRNLGTSCDPQLANPCAGADEYCQPILGAPSTGTCFLRESACQSDEQCTAPAFCIDEDQEVSALSDPTVTSPSGVVAYAAAGVCVNGLGKEDASCLRSSDCGAGFTCKHELVYGASGDSDRDSEPDVTDNCLLVANPAQADLDADGLGDACDRATCGNGVQEYDETCDDGNQTAGDGCSDLCAIEGATPACSNGRDDDGDGKVDFPTDPGCTDANDTSERGTASCDDGIDNDGDYGVDVGGDIACTTVFGWLETAQCKDGIDNEGDGKIDFDGGAHVHGEALTAPDPHCTSPGRNNEKPNSSCGLGAELPPLLLLFGWLSRRRLGARRL